MFKIENKTIELTRGDRVSFNISIPDYEFQIGDKIEFRVYKKNGLQQEPLIFKSVVNQEVSDSTNILLTSEDTSIGEMTNKPITYWYEIELNDNTTIIGYDEDGAKELILYPEGAE